MRVVTRLSSNEDDKREVLLGSFASDSKKLRTWIDPARKNRNDATEHRAKFLVL